MYSLFTSTIKTAASDSQRNIPKRPPRAPKRQGRKYGGRRQMNGLLLEERRDHVALQLLNPDMQDERVERLVRTLGALREAVR